MTIKTILLSGALALAAVTSSGVLAQTAKDYARYKPSQASHETNVQQRHFKTAAGPLLHASASVSGYNLNKYHVVRPELQMPLANQRPPRI